MQLKSQIKTSKLVQKRSQEAAPSQKSHQEHKTSDPRQKYRNNHPPQMPNSSSNKNINHQPNSSKQQELPENHSLTNSNLSRPRNSDSFFMVDKVVQLHQRLKNLHHFYKSRIEEEKAKTSQRNQVFMNIIEEMQRTHSQKVESFKKLIQDAEGEKKDVGLVDERMNEIKGSIDEILKQSQDLKVGNDRLQRQINQKQHVLREKEEQLSKLKEELMQTRNELEGFERLNLKQNKRNKEIVTIIDKAENNIGQLNNNHRT